jgi:predicted RecB family nuclease
MSMLWCHFWLSTGNRRYLELAVRYDQDNCRATKRVGEWVERRTQR